jgi:hypothetical protein
MGAFIFSASYETYISASSDAVGFQKNWDYSMQIIPVRKHG